MSQRQLRAQASAGFTLIEALIVVTLLGIAVLFASPALLSFFTRSQLKSASRDVASAYQLGRHLAVSRNVVMTVEAIDDGSVKEILIYETGGDPADPDHRVYLPEYVQLSAGLGDMKVDFKPNGLAEFGATDKCETVKVESGAPTNAWVNIFISGIVRVTENAQSSDCS